MTAQQDRLRVRLILIAVWFAVSLGVLLTGCSNPTGPQPKPKKCDICQNGEPEDGHPDPHTGSRRSS